MKKILIVTAMLLISGACFASTIVYKATLSGANQNPPVASSASGSATVTINTTLETMEVKVAFSGLSSTDTAAHIHCCVAPPGNTGVATEAPAFTGFPLGVTSGNFDGTFDLTSISTYNPAFVAANGGTASGAESVLLAGLAAGDAYLNIHTMNFPGGEIRGFLVATPEPGSMTLLVSSLAGLVFLRRKRR